jgi:hypothetical protein
MRASAGRAIARSAILRRSIDTSPDLNPIELCWSKLKALLRDFGARTRDALDDAIHRAMVLIDCHDAAAWCRSKEDGGPRWARRPPDSGGALYQ